MRRQRNSATWALLAILSLLFVLIVIGPREWQESTRRSARLRGTRAAKTTPTAAPIRSAPPAPVASLSAPTPVASLSAPTPVVRIPPPPPSPPMPSPEEFGVAVASDWVPHEPGLVRRLSRGADSPDCWLPPEVPAEDPIPLALTAEPEPSCWKTPTSLLEKLEQLGWECECCEWATAVRDLVIELTTGRPEPLRISEILTQLHHQTKAAATLARHLSDQVAAVELRRTQSALSRRLGAWGLTAALIENVPSRKTSLIDSARLAACVEDVAAETGDKANGQSWQEFLTLDALASLAENCTPDEVQSGRDLARSILRRFASARLDSRQRKFVATGAMARLRTELERWAIEPVANGQLSLLAPLENFEQRGLPSDANEIVDTCLKLAWSLDDSDPRREQLLSWLESNYRQSNLRLAVSSELINRLLPPQGPVEAPVRETILGIPTRGWSMASTNLTSQLVPDPSRLMMRLRADGEVVANTRSTSGSATILSKSDSIYASEKLIEVSPTGVRVLESESDARCCPRLRGICTDYDGVPLLGDLAQSLARKQHDETRCAAISESRRKLLAHVRQQVDEQMLPQIEKANQELREKLVGPLDRLRLSPHTVEMKTTADRMTVQLRLAADEQLSGHTPRPIAPGGSLLSLQLHESLVNNLMARLDLEGHTFTVADLRKKLAEAFNQPAMAAPADVPEDVSITFAEKDAVRLHCRDGRIELMLGLAELSTGLNQWYDLSVRVRYKPEARTLVADLVRDGTIQLASQDRLSLGSQVAVRGIFSKVFPADRAWSLVPDKIRKNGRLADLEVTQFVVEEGWIGLALGRKSKAGMVAQKPARN